MKRMRILCGSMTPTWTASICTSSTQQRQNLMNMIKDDMQNYDNKLPEIKTIRAKVN